MDLEALTAWLGSIRPWLENQAVWWSRPWQLFQIGGLIAAYALAHLAALYLRPLLQDRMREANANRAWMRVLVVAEAYLRPLALVTILWSAVLLLRLVTWPSRSYLLGLAAMLITAVVIVSIASRLIQHRLWRLTVRWGVTVIVTLHLLGVLPETIAALESIRFTFGATQFSFLVIVKAILTVALLLLGASWLVGLLSRRIEGIEDVSPSLKVLTDKVLRIVIYTVAVVLGLQTVGFDMTSLTVLSGAIGLGLGFGLQKIFSNLVAGFILLLDKSIKPGDVISLGDTFGWITVLSARYVSVNTRDGREYLIPNEDLITNQVINWTHSSDLVRLDIDFGVGYASDPHQVRRVAVEAAKSVQRVSDLPVPVCHITGFGDSSIDFVLRFWIRDPSSGLTNVRGSVYLALWDTLKENGIEIPYPRRDVTILNPIGKTTE